MAIEGYMNMEAISAHALTGLRDAADGIAGVTDQLEAMGADQAHVDAMRNALGVFDEYVDREPEVAVVALCNARNNWHAPGTDRRHRDEMKMTEQFADLDWNLALLKHKILEHRVIPVQAPIRVDGASIGECPVCGRAVDSLHDFAACTFCGSKLAWG